MELTIAKMNDKLQVAWVFLTSCWKNKGFGGNDREKVFT